jgi:parallel beta-helix repeat protein
MSAGWTWGRRPIRRTGFLGDRRLGGVALVGVVGPLLAVGVTAPAAAAVLAATAVPAPARVAGARPLRCGDAVMRDTTLTADLSNCRGTGLVLGADGITLDLNGHTITGAPAAADTLGILARGRRDVHITGSGRVRHFGTAVVLKNSTGSQVDQITVTDNDHGVTVAGGSADTVFHVTARRNFEGIHFSGGDRHQAVLNTVTDNGADASGIVLVGHTTRARILNNDLNGTEFAGIYLSDADRSVVEGNRMTDTGRGVFIFPGSRNRISYNQISGGRKRQTQTGIALSGGAGNVIDHNIIDKPTGNGIALSSSRPVGSFPPKGPPTIDTLVRGNVVRRAGDDGVAVKTADSGPVRRTRLAGNRAERSADDGFDVRSATTTIKGNVARANADYGILAVRGVTDGGHNRASGNGNRAQCRNIQCR